MPDIEHKRGEFLPFRAVTKVHLGAIQTDLDSGDVVLFDGQTMKRGDDVHQVANLKAAIKLGWLVPEAQVGGEYRPQPAGVQVHNAQSTGRDRGESRTIGMVADEEQDLGTRGDIRAGKGKQVSASQAAPSRAAPTGAKMVRDNLSVVTEGGQEGQIVGRVKDATHKKVLLTPANATTVLQEIRKIDNAEGSSRAGFEPVRRAKATGDVQEAISGDELSELLPDAASSDRPEAGEAGEGLTDEEIEERNLRLAQAAADAERRRMERGGVSGPVTAKVSVGKPKETDYTAKVSSGSKDPDYTARVSSGGSSSVGGDEDGEVVAKVGAKAPAPTKAAPVEAAEVEADRPSPEIIQAKLDMIRQFVPGFDWDVNAQWRQRVQKALTYKNNLPVLNAILSIETESVRKHVMLGLYGGK